MVEVPLVSRSYDPHEVVSYIDESGRFTQSPNQLAHQLRERRKRCSVYLGSEFDANARAKLLTSDNWSGAWGDKGGRDDCGGTWNPIEWTKVWAGTQVLSGRTYIDKRHQRTGKNAAFYVVLLHRATHMRWLFSKMHTANPSEAEIRSGRFHSEVGATYHADALGYRSIGEELFAEYDCDVWVASADWNINLRERWAYEWLEAWGAVSDLRMCWHYGNLPVHGTYNNEIIDGTLIRGARQIEQPQLLHKAAGDDHTGELLKLVANNRKAA